MMSFFENRGIMFSVITGASLLTGFLAGFFEVVPPEVSLALYINAYLFGGYYIVRNSSLVKKLSFDIDLLMLVAALGAAFLGKWEEGALLLFLFSLGHSLEKLAMKKAAKSIESLATLSPQTALLKKDGKTIEIPVGDVKPFDRIVIKPHTKISADGIVVKGSGSVDQSSITGESMPVDKLPLPDFNMDDLQHIPQQHKVFSGTLNGNGYLEIIATKKAEDCTLSKLIRLVHEARQQRSPTQKFTHTFEKYFVPVVLALVFLLNFAFLVIDESFSDSFYRAITVLVVSSPCALVISTPSAILSGIARAARQGILVKGGRPLEDLAFLKALAFDKTGTLTKGEPRITDLIPLNGVGRKELLQTVLSVENHSSHPLAKAIVKEGQHLLADFVPYEVDNFRSLTGKGVKAQIAGKEVTIGNQEIFDDDLSIHPAIIEHLRKLENDGKTCLMIKKESVYEGIIALMDTPREESSMVIKRLKQLGINRISLLSGDNQRAVKSVGEQLGISDVWGNLLPEEKVDAILALKSKEKKVAMVGDGVNDAPAMAHSTVGIAMGAVGSDVALETADIALLSDKLSNLPFAIGLSRKTKNIIRQNLLISLGVIATMIPLTLLGIASIGPAVLIHEGSTVLVVFNALRLLAYKEK